MSRPLTSGESRVFNGIRDGSNIVLMQTQFDGEETAVICAMTGEGDDIHVTPLAVLVTDAMFGRLSAP